MSDPKPIRKKWLQVLFAGIVFYLAGCAYEPEIVTPPPPVTPPPAPMALERLPKNEYPVFNDHFEYERLADSIDMSLVYLRRLPLERPVALGRDTYTVAHLITSLETFKHLIAGKPDIDRLNNEIQNRYRVYRSSGRSADYEMLYTGYYEPVIEGRLTPSAEFDVPVHGRPLDLVDIDLSPFAEDLAGRRIVGRYDGKTVVPYPERSEIQAQSDFIDLAPPIAWLRDDYDLFNLQIQGSGKIDLGDGTMLDVHFDSSNGHSYQSVGLWLIEKGKIKRKDLSMQSIRKYLAEHPSECREILNQNPRYVFFHVVDQGPIGALGVPLTAGRSLALDRSIFPLAALVYVTTEIPVLKSDNTVEGWSSYGGFALAQDTGSAITGPGRADFYWGTGHRAGAAAGRMKNKGRLYFLILEPNGELPPRTALSD